MKNKNEIQNLMIIGGGIMGLMTAYYASLFVKKIIILEKSVVGSENKEASSFSFTRSMRTDYIDPFYAILAYEAQILWEELQEQSGDTLYKNCGCLNLVKKSITPDVKNTHGYLSYQTLKKLNLQPRTFSKNALQKRFPQFAADFGFLDTKGGYFYLPAIVQFLLKELKKKNVVIKENSEIIKIIQNEQLVKIQTTKQEFTANQVVITAGRWANDVIKLIKKNTLSFPITVEKPKEKKYFYPSKDKWNLFLPENFPVFAYLDVGIYGHPIFDRKKGAVKISYYYPPDLDSLALGFKRSKKINSISDFIKECMPVLRDVRCEDYDDADMCSYDFVADENFIIGKLPGFSQISIGTGWLGTGFKFAPLIGKILSQLALQNSTVYDIKQFSPARFIK